MKNIEINVTLCARRAAIFGSASMLAFVMATAAQAQSVTSEGDPTSGVKATAMPGEIIVTARKREETLMQAPVALQVITAETIDDLKVQSVADIATVTPGLIINTAFGTVGSVPFLRGIGSGPTGSFIDQSVGLAIDGVGQGHGTFYRAGAFDLERVEVLKGPQGLYFGKSTTAGVLSLTTADPTPDWQSELTAGYEFVGDEVNLAGFISGPITDNLGIRVAGYHTDMKGWQYNPNPAPDINRRQEQRATGGRITLAYDDGDRFQARFKTTYFDATSSSAAYQFYDCASGTPQNPIAARFDNCKLDKFNAGFDNAKPYNPDVNWLASLGTGAFLTGSPIELAGATGEPRSTTENVLSALQLDFDLTDGLTLTSITGYSWVDVTDFNGTNAFAPGTLYSIGGGRTQSDWSQEIRFNGNLPDSMINFLFGGLYTSSKVKGMTDAAIPPFTVWNVSEAKEESEVYSIFGEFSFEPIKDLEFSAGLRHTEIERELTSLIYYGNTVPPSQNGINVAPLISPGRTRVSESNTSPELTVAYRPNLDLTLYGSYKWGYKGPGFNVSSFLAGSFLAAQPSPFGGEKVRGGEVGVKSQLANRSLSLSLVAYHYKYLGLQVSNFDFDTQTITVSNGADARIRGVEAELAYVPPFASGLQLNLAVNYNDSEYTSFPGSPCFAGQSVAEGCVPNSSGVAVQDLTGRTLYMAPKLTGFLSAAYETDIGEDFFLRTSGRVSYNSGYNPLSNLLPGAYQEKFATVDASVRFGSATKAWELGLIGKNLTNKYNVVVGYDSGVYTPGVNADAAATASRGRQVMLELTLRPNLF